LDRAGGRDQFDVVGCVASKKRQEAIKRREPNREPYDDFVKVPYRLEHPLAPIDPPAVDVKPRQECDVLAQLRFGGLAVSLVIAAYGAINVGVGDVDARPLDKFANAPRSNSSLEALAEQVQVARQ